eukprot:TRINITY_DN29270_c1_g1_i1.p2 TRINITY_DN29270_c1_g1~~TRINITY_DN29270_c1_g1_i1.p2  ORF type:complete len:531 (+),score=125.65 TRINITY_DN29270_c1_g1_i1:140-1732(+)
MAVPGDSDCLRWTRHRGECVCWRLPESCRRLFEVERCSCCSLLLALLSRRCDEGCSCCCRSRAFGWRSDYDGWFRGKSWNERRGAGVACGAGRKDKTDEKGDWRGWRNKNWHGYFDCENEGKNEDMTEGNDKNTGYVSDYKNEDMTEGNDKNTGYVSDYKNEGLTEANNMNEENASAGIVAGASEKADENGDWRGWCKSGWRMAVASANEADEKDWRGWWKSSRREKAYENDDWRGWCFSGRRSWDHSQRSWHWYNGSTRARRRRAAYNRRWWPIEAKFIDTDVGKAGVDEGIDENGATNDLNNKNFDKDTDMKFSKGFDNDSDEDDCMVNKDTDKVLDKDKCVEGHAVREDAVLPAAPVAAGGKPAECESTDAGDDNAASVADAASNVTVQACGAGAIDVSIDGVSVAVAASGDGVTDDGSIVEFAGSVSGVGDDDGADMRDEKCKDGQTSKDGKARGNSGIECIGADKWWMQQSDDDLCHTVPGRGSGVAQAVNVKCGRCNSPTDGKVKYANETVCSSCWCRAVFEKK